MAMYVELGIVVRERVTSTTDLHHPSEEEDHGHKEEEATPRRQRVNRTIHDEHPTFLGGSLVYSEETSGYIGGRGG